MASLTVRCAGLADAGSVGALIDAMDAHYSKSSVRAGGDEAEAVVARTLEDAEGTRFLVVYDGDRPVGLACFAILRPGHRLQGVLFLKDLFVLPDIRSKGVGRRIMQALAAFAQERRIGRIDLTTDLSNVGAQRLYDRLGGLRQEKVMFRFEGKDLEKLAAAAVKSMETE